jgi:RES domain-containing protein
MVSLWRIATDTPDYTADDLTGKGAEVTGGRWNRKGTAVLYTSTNIALACLETVVHLNASGRLPLNRYLVELIVPNSEWAARSTASPSSLPLGWDAEPAGMISLDFGTNWLASKKTLLLQIPSVIVPEEANILINPAHPAASTVTATKRRRWLYDPRLR